MRMSFTFTNEDVARGLSMYLGLYFHADDIPGMGLAPEFLDAMARVPVHRCPHGRRVGMFCLACESYQGTGRRKKPE